MIDLIYDKMFDNNTNFGIILLLFLCILVYSQSVEMQDLRNKLDILNLVVMRLNNKINNRNN